MVYFATEGRKNLKVVDNFCGSGTILTESLLVGNQVFGGDVDPESVNITRENLANLGHRPEDKVKQLNAVSTNWPDHFFDAAISNFPWGKQVEVKNITDLYIGTLKEYARIVKSNGVLCLLLTKPEILIKHAKKYLPDSSIKNIKLGLLGQTPSIVLIQKK